MRSVIFIISSLSLFVSVSLAASDSGLLIYCPMDSIVVSGSTYVVNKSNSSLPDLVVQGNCVRDTSIGGFPNKALKLDGSTFLYCTVPADTVSKIAGGDFSLGIMFNTTYQTGGMEARFDMAGMGDPFNKGFFLSLNNSRGRIFLGDHGYYDTPDSLCDGKWHFLMATRSSGKVTLYLDGKGSDSGAYVGTIPPGTNTFIAGRHGTKNLTYFKGEIDELFLYSRALTSTEVNFLYQEMVTMPLRIYSPDSVAAYPFVFTWGAVTNAIAYAVEVDTSASFSKPLISLPVEDTTVQLGAALPAGNYYFRIGCNFDDRSEFYFFNSKQFICK